MTVKELIKELSKADPDSLVIQQRDPEGNGYAPLHGVDPNAIKVGDHHDMEIYDPDWDAQETCLEEEEWAKLKAGPRCVVLWPVH